MNTKLNYIQNWPELAQKAKWSASALAKWCGVSIRTLERYFVKRIGKSPKVWLLEQRQCCAIELLRDGSSVKETSSLMGYRHATTFAREFKKLSGQCPNALILMQKNKPIHPRNIA